MCFGKDNGPMGPGAVVVSVAAREWDEESKEWRHLKSFPSGLVLSSDWDAFTCLVEWSNGETNTHHFSEVDVLVWQSGVTPPEFPVDCHHHD